MQLQSILLAVPPPDTFVFRGRAPSPSEAFLAWLRSESGDATLDYANVHAGCLFYGELREARKDLGRDPEPDASSLPALVRRVPRGQVIVLRAPVLP